MLGEKKLLIISELLMLGEKKLLIISELLLMEPHFASLSHIMPAKYKRVVYDTVMQEESIVVVCLSSLSRFS